MVWESDEVEKYYTEWLHLGEKPKIYYSTDKQAFTKKRDDVLLERDKARFDNSFNYIAYSRVETSAGSINTAEHFEWAAKQGFTALKGDVSPTSDGELIMCHDAGFVLTAAYDDSDGAVNYIDDSVDYDATTAKPIIELTKAQCLKIQHSVKKDYVCDFDTYIKICKKY